MKKEKMKKEKNWEEFEKTKMNELELKKQMGTEIIDYALFDQSTKRREIILMTFGLIIFIMGILFGMLKVILQ
jgi:hypothetical protein